MVEEREWFLQRLERDRKECTYVVVPSHGARGGHFVPAVEYGDQYGTHQAIGGRACFRTIRTFFCTAVMIEVFLRPGAEGGHGQWLARASAGKICGTLTRGKGKAMRTRVRKSWWNCGFFSRPGAPWCGCRCCECEKVSAWEEFDKSFVESIQAGRAICDGWKAGALSCASLVS